MFRAFIQWYNNFFKKKPEVIFILILVALLGGVNTVIDGVKAIGDMGKEIYSFVYVDEEKYRKLETVDTGLNVEFIDQLFGKPSINRSLARDGALSIYNERLYVDDNFFLYLISDKTNKSVLYYSITIRNKDFNPSIPLRIINGIDDKNSITNLRLGKMTLDDLKVSRIDCISPDFSSKFVSYTETHYFGNPGFYKYYQFGYAPAGYSDHTDQKLSQIIELKLLDKDDKLDYKKIDNFRRGFKPNSFGVISDGLMDDNLSEYLRVGMIGIDYFDARQFNK